MRKYSFVPAHFRWFVFSFVPQDKYERHSREICHSANKRQRDIARIGFVQAMHIAQLEILEMYIQDPLSYFSTWMSKFTIYVKTKIRLTMPSRKVFVILQRYENTF